MDLLKAAKAHVGMTAFAAALVVSGGVATAAVVVSPASSSDDVFDVPATTEPAATTDAPAPVESPEPPVSAQVEAPAATVEPVTEPVTPAAVEPVLPALAEPPADPKPYDPMATFTDDAGNTYLPAPEATVAPLPGEPGYVKPAD